MGWDDVIRAGLAVAHDILKDGLEATVSHEARSGQDDYGQPTYAAPVSRLAVVSDSDEIVRISERETIVASYRVQFLSAVAIDTRDRITLPDGRHAPILRVDRGVLDDAGAPLLTAAVCG